MDYYCGLLCWWGYGFLGLFLKLGLFLVGSVVVFFFGDLVGGLVKKIKYC